MNTQPTDYTKSPVGRLLKSYIFEPRQTDVFGRPKPQDKWRYEAWIAIRKDDPNFDGYWAQIAAIAQRDWPNGEFNNQAFSWKYKDGDGMTSKGTPYPAHCHGCHLLSFTSSFAPQVFNAQNQQIALENQAAKAGDYVEIYGNFKGNATPTKPGIFLNLNMIRIVAFGDAIVDGPSADQAFGAAPAALPPGASVTPVSPAMAAPGAPGMAPAPAVAPAAGLPGAAPVNPTHAAAPSAPAIPAVTNPVAPPAAVASPVATPPAPGAATGYPSEGYTGYMAPAPAAAPAVAPAAAPAVAPAAAPGMPPVR